LQRGCDLRRCKRDCAGGACAEVGVAWVDCLDVVGSRARDGALPSVATAVCVGWVRKTPTLSRSPSATVISGTPSPLKSPVAEKRELGKVVAPVVLAAKVKVPSPLLSNMDMFWLSASARSVLLSLLKSPTTKSKE
jgi:hypothetical protein